MIKSRVSHLMKDWAPEIPPRTAQPEPKVEPAKSGYPLPRGIKRINPSPSSEQELAGLEAALQQQLTFRSWAREHPAS